MQRAMELVVALAERGAYQVLATAAVGMGFGYIAKAGGKFVLKILKYKYPRLPDDLEGQAYKFMLVCVVMLASWMAGVFIQFPAKGLVMSRGEGFIWACVGGPCALPLLSALFYLLDRGRAKAAGKPVEDLEGSSGDITREPFEGPTPEEIAAARTKAMDPQDQDTDPMRKP